MAIQPSIEYVYKGQKDQTRTHEFSKVDPKTGNTVTIVIEDNNNNGADYYDSAIIKGGNVSIFKSDFQNMVKKVGNGKGYNKSFKRQYHDPVQAGQIEATSCKDIQEGNRNTLGSVMKCLGFLSKSATGSIAADAEKAPKKASATSHRHHKSHAKPAPAPKDTTPPEVIDTSVNAGLEPANKEETPATPPAATPPAVSTTPPATSTTPPTPAPTQQVPAPAAQAPAPKPAPPPAPAPAAVSKPVPAPTAAAAPPPPPPAPPAPQAVRYAPPQQGYYAPQPAYSTGFSPASMLLGALGGMGLMAMFGGRGGGFGSGFGLGLGFGLGSSFGGGFGFGAPMMGGFGFGFPMMMFGGFGGGFGGHGFHHPHHYDQFANAFTKYEYSGHHHQPNFGRYGSFHHEPPIGFHNGGFTAHHGGFGRRFG